MIFVLNATWEYIDLYNDEFIKILSDITEKTSSHKQLQDIIIVKAQRSWTHKDSQWQRDHNRLKQQWICEKSLQQRQTCHSQSNNSLKNSKE